MLPERRQFSFTCLLLLIVIGLQACATVTPPLELHPVVEQQRVTELNRAILALGDAIDPGEAQRAARIAIKYSQQLAQEYEISNSPLVHNMLVNLGMRPRGLCIHWTSDLLERLKEERFHSLDLHWGIANYQLAFRIEHSTAIISARGTSLDQGLILDPWRNSGQLFWAPTMKDPEYKWHAQSKVHQLKREQRDSHEQ